MCSFISGLILTPVELSKCLKFLIFEFIFVFSFLFQKLALFGVVDWKGVIYQNSAISRSPDGCNVVLASPGNQICEISESSIPRD